MSTQPVITGIFSMPASQTAPPANQPVAVGSATAPTPASAATPASATPAPTPAPAQSQTTSAPMAVDPTPDARVVEEQLSLESLRNNPTPAAVVQTQMLYMEKLQRELAQAAEQNAALMAREKQREDAERVRLENERAAADQAHKETMSQSRLKLEANLRAALDGAKAMAPEAINDADIDKLTTNFRADLDKAGFDEQQIAEVARKMEDSAELIVRASKSASAARADLEKRELVKAIDMLKPLTGNSFTVSGGFSNQPFQAQSLPQQQAPTAGVFGGGGASATTASSSSTMFGATTLWPAQRQHDHAAQSLESGVVTASKTPSVGGMFAGVLSSLGKRNASDMSGVDGGGKRSIISEAVAISAQQHHHHQQQQPSQPAAPGIDFTKSDWMQQVIAKSLIDGDGVPSEKTLRHGGFGVEHKTLASANGGTFVQKQRVPCLSAPYTGPITMEQLNTTGFDFCVNGIAKMFSGEQPRPQLRAIVEHMQVSATFPEQACNYSQNRNMLPANLLAMGTPNFAGF